MNAGPKGVGEPGLPRWAAVVFAGGGCRCVWQVGFWQVVGPALAFRPRVVGAVSAGAAMACMLFADVVDAGLAEFKRRVADNPRNAYPGNLLRRRPVFPHARIYRSTILGALDESALARLRTGPEIRILLARVPRWLGARSGVVAGFAAYQAERLLANRVHPTFARHFGFAPEIASLKHCRSPEEVADLVLQSSCTPPFTPVLFRAGRPVLDGGLVDNVPVATVRPGEGPILVLLTRRYPHERIPLSRDRTYVQPSAPIPIEKWDYTNPEGIQAAYELGRRDGERFAADLLRGRPDGETASRGATGLKPAR